MSSFNTSEFILVEDDCGIFAQVSIDIFEQQNGCLNSEQHADIYNSLVALCEAVQN